MFPATGRSAGTGVCWWIPWVRARAVLVADVLGDDAVEVPEVEHENVVQALATQRPEKALAHGVHVRGAHLCADNPDAGGAGECIEGGPESVVAIAKQKPWRRTGGSRVAELLRHPGLRRGGS